MAAPKRAMVTARSSAAKGPRRKAGRSVRREAWLAGWHLPPHLWFDIAAVGCLLAELILLFAALPDLPASTIAHPMFALRSFEQSLAGGGAVVVPVVLIAITISIVRLERFDGAPVPWLRFAGVALLIVDWLVLQDAIGSRGGGMVGAELRQLVVNVMGSLGWLIWMAAVLVGLIWAFRLSLRHVWTGLRHLMRAGRWSMQAVVHAAKLAVATLYRKPARVPSPTTTTALEAAPSPQPMLPVIKTVTPVRRVESVALAAQDAKVTRREIFGAHEAPASMGTRRAGGVTWQLPETTLLNYGIRVEATKESIYERANLILRTLADFGIAAKVQEIRPGPTVTQFGIRPDAGVKVARIAGLQNDLALAMEAQSIRVEAPVPGKPYVGIEVPNPITSPVTLRELMESQDFAKYRAKGAILPIVLGSDVAGEPVFGDLTRMPHLLIAGATGSGKSVGINALICCLLFHCSPDELQLIMVDPKQVELTGYNNIPHLKAPVIVDMDKVVGALDWCLAEMERRYGLFAHESFRDILRYNDAARKRDEPALPYIVVIIDELADLMMTAPDQVEQQICRLAQKARATGIHLVLATQRPSVDVITGLIKANFPSRIAFAVSSGVDSKTILDSPGAERLLGRGDMLYTPAGVLRPMRVQGTWVQDDEIEALIAFWREQREAAGDRWQSTEEQRALLESWSAPQEEDPERQLLDEATVVLQAVVDTAAAQGKEPLVTLSLLQRRLRLGQSRAALIMDELFDQGIVGTPRGPSKARPILLTPSAALLTTGTGDAQESSTEPVTSS